MKTDLLRKDLLRTASDRSDVLKAAEVLRAAGDRSADVLRVAGDRSADVLRSAGGLSAEARATAEHAARDLAGWVADTATDVGAQVAEIGGAIGGVAADTLAELPRKARRVPLWLLILVVVTAGVAGVLMWQRRSQRRQADDHASHNGQSHDGSVPPAPRTPASAGGRPGAGN